MLRSIRSAFAATAAAVVMTAASLGAHAGQQDFTVVNQSGQDIYYIFVSPDYSDNWGDDVLAQNILPAGSTVDIRMDNFGSHCTFDIQVADRDGDALEFWGVDLCRVSQVVVE